MDDEEVRCKACGKVIKHNEAYYIANHEPGPFCVECHDKRAGKQEHKAKDKP
jgi:DNA-directed RNA polymerase subunit N (RpoN/RPB10)